jgi:hypothetical protein
VKYFFFTIFITLGAIIQPLNAQNVGVGTDNPVEFFSVGASSQFRVNANGNLVRINDVQYNFPSVQATSGSVLANDGSGNLSWTKVTTGNISATGTADNTTFLRGDGSWQTPAGGGGGGATTSSYQTLNASITTYPTYSNLGSGVSLTPGDYMFTSSFSNLSFTGGDLVLVRLRDALNNIIFEVGLNGGQIPYAGVSLGFRISTTTTVQASWAHGGGATPTATTGLTGYLMIVKSH